MSFISVELNPRGRQAHLYCTSSLIHTRFRKSYCYLESCLPDLPVCKIYFDAGGNRCPASVFYPRRIFVSGSFVQLFSQVGNCFTQRGVFFLVAGISVVLSSALQNLPIVKIKNWLSKLIYWTCVVFCVHLQDESWNHSTILWPWWWKQASCLWLYTLPLLGWEHHYTPHTTPLHTTPAL